MLIIRLVIFYFAAVVMCDHYGSSDELNVYVDIGESANLSCIEEQANRTLSCMFERFDSNGLKDLELGEASMIAEEEKSSYIGNGIDNCAFELMNVTAADLTLWKGTLGWKQDEDHQSYRICKVRLIQKVSPTFLEIQNKSEMEIIIDDDEAGNNTLTLKCCSDNTSAPPPQLNFVYDGNVVENATYNQDEYCLIWSNITFSWTDSNKQINCTLKHPMVEDDVIDSMTLNIEHGPVLLEEKEDRIVVAANPEPEINPKTHFKIEQHPNSVNTWEIYPIDFSETEQTYNVSVSNVYKTLFVPFVIPAMTSTTTTTTEIPTTVPSPPETEKIAETTSSTQKPPTPKPAKYWTTMKIVLLVLGVSFALILLALLALYLAYSKGYLGTEHLIPKPDYPEVQPEPAVLFQASPINMEL